MMQPEKKALEAALKQYLPRRAESWGRRRGNDFG